MPRPDGPQFKAPHFNPENDFYGKMSELVPISQLKRMTGNNLRYTGDDLKALLDDINTNGLRSPAMLEYYQPSRTASMGEGHHRLAALEMGGYTHMPTTVFRNEYADHRGRSIPVRGIEPNQHDYVPGNLKPSDIMDIED